MSASSNRINATLRCADPKWRPCISYMVIEEYFYKWVQESDPYLYYYGVTCETLAIIAPLNFGSKSLGRNVSRGRVLLKLHAFLDFAAPENVGLSQGAA